MKTKLALFAILVLALLAVGCSGAPAAQQPAKQLTYGYVTPGPDTWYKRDVEGFQACAKEVGANVVVLNSEYNTEKEIANIDSMINQKVDGLSMFSFNENGANIASDKAKAAKIPLVVTDNVGQVIRDKKEVVAAVDFDWDAMGKDYAQWMAKTYPGEDFAVITGNFESLPMQKINKSLLDNSNALGKNKQVLIKDANFDPNKAVDVANDFVNSGTKFGLLFVADEDMAAAVIRSLKDKNLLNNPIKVFSENGSTAGIPLLKDGSLKYSISSSPGWEGYVACYALHAYVTGQNKTANRQLMLPIISVTPQNVDDKSAVVPWEVDPIYKQLTQKYFPDILPTK